MFPILAIASVLFAATAATGQVAAGGITTTDRYDAAGALARSQQAVGTRLHDLAFVDAHGNAARLSDYAGQPLLVSLVFTSCYHTCPVTTRRLADAVRAARDALDEDSFRVVTIGFDTARDTPDAMRHFATEQGIDIAGWDFLSASAETIAALTDQLGFLFYPSPRGFDHIVQVSVIDRESRVHAQVYGEAFELPWLVEPLKDLVLNRPGSAGDPWASLVDRIRIICTVYDPTTGRYHFDNSLFLQIAAGLIVVVSIGTYLVREWRAARRLQVRR